MSLLDRRGFLIRGFAPVALAALAGPREGDIVIVQPGYYLLFVDALAVDVHSIVKSMELPQGCTINVIPVRLSNVDSIDDAVRLYKMEGTP